MTYAKGTPEFEYNLDLMHEFEDCVPMTRPERKLLHYWVQYGNDINSGISFFNDLHYALADYMVRQAGEGL